VSASHADAASIERAGSALAALLGVKVSGDEGGTDVSPTDSPSNDA
jgi:hypothetical protein